MASLEKRSNQFRVVFRVGKRKFARALKTSSQKAANACLARLDDNLRRLELGLIEVPAGADIVTFLLSDGRALAKPSPRPRTSLKALFDAYFGNLPEGNIEPATIGQMKTHMKQLFKHLGMNADANSLTLPDLQAYVQKRAMEKGIRGRKVTPTTIRKAIVTLRTVWNWGMHFGLIEKPFPNKGLKFPKFEEKPPFQSFAEVERQVQGMSAVEAADLWDCAFLTRDEIADLLRQVESSAVQPVVYATFYFAAHTGARRSEMLRARIGDIDFINHRITIRERKKAHDARTTRRVPMSPPLRRVLQAWVQVHPGGEFLFCNSGIVENRQKRRTARTAFSQDQIHDLFKRSLADTKYRSLRGWHVFRHSFCSNAAAAGIDQRVINEWVGHLSQAMERRYRHAVPDQQRAIELVYA